jgi:hypothetical protein
VGSTGPLAPEDSRATHPVPLNACLPWNACIATRLEPLRRLIYSPKATARGRNQSADICHAERSEASRSPARQTLRYAQGDTVQPYVHAYGSVFIL